MDEKQYELVEIQVDAELLEQLEAVIAPMGLTPEMLAVKFFEFCVDPATQELAISLLLKWKAEQEMCIRDSCWSLPRPLSGLPSR